jgi:hypothetical protein
VDSVTELISTGCYDICICFCFPVYCVWKTHQEMFSVAFIFFNEFGILPLYRPTRCVSFLQEW